MAVSIKGRQRPCSAPTMALISFGVGMSTPTFSLPFCRRSARRSLPRVLRVRRSRTTFRATSPRSCASASNDPRLTKILRVIAADRGCSSSDEAPGAGDPLRSWSSNSRTRGALRSESLRAKVGVDVEPQVGPVLVDGRALEPVLLACGDPFLSGIAHPRALACGRVNTVADFRQDRGRELGRVLLPGEGLDVALACLVDVIEDPSFLRLAPGRGPGSLADRQGEAPN